MVCQEPEDLKSKRWKQIPDFMSPVLHCIDLQLNSINPKRIMYTNFVTSCKLLEESI